MSQGALAATFYCFDVVVVSDGHIGSIYTIHRVHIVSTLHQDWHPPLRTMFEQKKLGLFVL